MSDYPGAIDTFTAQVDNVDTIDAADVNELQYAISAIETELGTNPSSSFADVATRLTSIETDISNSTIFRVCGLVSNPQAVYAQRAQIPLFRAAAALTITRIHINCNVTSQNIAGDLKWADDIIDGSFASATVIDVCDTTSGVVTITSGFDDATVPSGKYVYFQLDSSPNAAIKDFYLEVYYMFD